MTVRVLTTRVLIATALFVPASIVRAQMPATPAPAPAVLAPAADAKASVKSAKPRATTKTITGTVAAFDAGAGIVRIASEKGEAIAAAVQPASKFSRKAAPAQARDFAPGEKIVARVSLRPDGAVWLRELWDSASHDAYTHDRREVCRGVVAANESGKLQVRRADGSILAFRVTDKTQVRKGGSSALIAAFAPGTPVAVQPRGLPSGDLMAAIVADSAAEVAEVHVDGLTRWKGTLETLDSAAGRLILRRDDGASRPVALAPSLTIKRGKTTLDLKELAPGATISLHLQKGADAAGLRTADAITISTPRKAADAK